jgi:hypothetical protein
VVSTAAMPETIVSTDGTELSADYRIKKSKPRRDADRRKRITANGPFEAFLGGSDLAAGCISHRRGEVLQLRSELVYFAPYLLFSSWPLCATARTTIA